LALTPRHDARSNEVFLREVDDELRRDQALDLWRQWGRWLIVAIVAGLALFAAWLGWRSHRETVAGREGEQLTTAYDALGGGRTAEAGTSLATLAGSSREGYRVMARFTQADLQLQAHKDTEAAATFAAIAADGSVEKAFRDLATIRQTAAEYDRLKPQVVVERLRPLAVAGSPWLGSAGELLAAAYLKEGRRDLAATLFGQIAQGDDVPQTLRQRAVQMASAMSAGPGNAGTGAPAAGEGSKAR
jgi:hypothetical protein